MKESIEKIFYKAVINKLKEQQEKYDIDASGGLMKSNKNNARVALTVLEGFNAISDLAGMIMISASCDFSEIKEE